MPFPWTYPQPSPSPLNRSLINSITTQSQPHQLHHNISSQPHISIFSSLPLGWRLVCAPWPTWQTAPGHIDRLALVNVQHQPPAPPYAQRLGPLRTPPTSPPRTDPDLSATDSLPLLSFLNQNDLDPLLCPRASSRRSHTTLIAVCDSRNPRRAPDAASRRLDFYISTVVFVVKGRTCMVLFGAASTSRKET